MGALHAGHLKLVSNSLAGNQNTVVSIFVNPLQFAPTEDFSRYPRPLDQDLKLCREAGVAAVFVPETEGFYASDHTTYVNVEVLDLHLCGATRPGHFRGVCTVVLKLLNIVQPTRAYFGQKDIQQALILRKMIQDLSLDVELDIVPTVREPSGLALSSRNMYLNPEEKLRATALFRGLTMAKSAYGLEERSADVLKKIVRGEIEAATPTRIDYIEVVSQGLLEPVEMISKPSVLALAVYFGKTRLIDNLLLG
jgi:pantoate--beta-alanine ligase